MNSPNNVRPNDRVAYKLVTSQSIISEIYYGLSLNGFWFTVYLEILSN